ncbi:hypothetical protein ISN45_Aa08g005910 [Arabidopsis thaliana x Arabidopsis arenosa]|uniref:Transmembrane protein n=1 Tax=Arabidopsis thaliana x Arabidopsis arenosa TaxID=1240361 RepID=A0A8T1XME7_9BRAS|nr:hypothetical protein ISN45_Aa08g005910 [Arabidopsis thaliana x Arabidopsis arenosa]
MVQDESRVSVLVGLMVTLDVVGVLVQVVRLVAIVVVLEPVDLYRLRLRFNHRIVLIDSHEICILCKRFFSLELCYSLSCKLIIYIHIDENRFIKLLVIVVGCYCS